MLNIKINYLVYPIIFGVALGWFVSSLAGSLSLRPKALPVAKARQIENAIPPMEAAEKIISANIFDLELKPAPSEEEVAEAAAQSLPPFSGKLMGVFKAFKGQSGIAIISMGDNTLILKVGAEKEGVKLLELEEFAAVIEYNKRKYELALEIGENIMNRLKAEKEGTSVVAKIVEGGNINIVVARDELVDELQDLNKVLQSALISPNYVNGNFQGYRVMRIKDDSPLKKLGLATGDVIMRVNGAELKSPEVLFSMLGQIEEISAVSLDMIRNNEKKTIFVEIQ